MRAVAGSGFDEKPEPISDFTVGKAASCVINTETVIDNWMERTVKPLDL